MVSFTCIHGREYFYAREPSPLPPRGCEAFRNWLQRYVVSHSADASSALREAKGGVVENISLISGFATLQLWAFAGVFTPWTLSVEIPGPSDPTRRSVRQSPVEVRQVRPFELQPVPDHPETLPHPPTHQTPPNSVEPTWPGQDGAFRFPVSVITD